MGRRKHFYENQKNIRDRLNMAIEIGEDILQQEERLIEQLKTIDRNRYFVRCGSTTLKGFLLGIGFTRTQAQRITTQVRRRTIYENGE